ncbi:class I SAM-dependent methyltransferase [Spirillospora sp. CA-108201]
METVEFGTGPVRITGGAPGPDGGGARPRPPAAPTREEPRPAPPAPRAPIKADASALPYRNNTFSLVTARFSLYTLGDPGDVLRELLRVCRPGGRVVVADLVRGNLAGPERDRIERLRDPDHPGTPSIARLTEMITSVGGSIRRLDVFTVERPVEPWLAGARDDAAADRIRAALLDEVDGGPRTGAKPRVIGGELWFTQSWAHVAAEPI